MGALARRELKSHVALHVQALCYHLLPAGAGKGGAILGAAINFESEGMRYITHRFGHIQREDLTNYVCRWEVHLVVTS